MAPEEETHSPAEQSAPPPAGEGARPPGRRSGRGRRGRGRRHRDRPAPAQPEQIGAPVEPGALRESPEPLESEATATPPEPELAPEAEMDEEELEPATIPELAEEVEPQRGPPPPPSPVQQKPPFTAVQDALDQVTHIVETLRATLMEMEDVLELLEELERQGAADQRELDSLRRALHQLHHPREGGRHKRGR